MKIILASKSPRRGEILRSIGWDFETQAANIDETRLASEDAVTYVRRLARQKAATIAERAPDRLVLGADTVVVIDGQILGQPRDDDDARRMLTLLSGKWHDVLTGVAMIKG
ncbi:MAG TPA: Maf family protein, partial [Pyrinomonadaceae bacterium]|nr:Maf family protein [Pyrinomonadaceae bacterium]